MKGRAEPLSFLVSFDQMRQRRLWREARWFFMVGGLFFGCVLTWGLDWVQEDWFEFGGEASGEEVGCQGALMEE